MTAHNAEALVDAICAAFRASELTQAPKPLPDTAYFAFRQSYAAARAAMVAALLPKDAPPDLQDRRALLIKASGNAPLATAPALQLRALAHATHKTLRVQRLGAQAYWRTDYPRKTPAQNQARLLRAMELNDFDTFRDVDMAMDGLTPFQTRLLEYKRLERMQHRTEADLIGAALIAENPDLAIKSGVGFWSTFRRPGQPDTGLNLARSATDPLTLERGLELLRLTEHVGEALRIAQDNAALIASNLRLAMTATALVLGSDSHAPDSRARILAAGARLPPVQQPSFFAKYGYGDEVDVTALLQHHDDLGIPAFWSLPLIDAALAELDLTALSDAAVDALPDLLRIDLRELLEYDQPLRAALAATGACVGQAARADAIALRAKARLSAADTAVSHTRAALSGADAQTLARLCTQQRPLMLYSTHTARIGLANYAPAIAATDAGYDVISVAGHAWAAASELYDKAQSDLHAAGVAIEVINIKFEDPASQTKIYLDHLGKGGALAITNDGLLGPGIRVAVPWFLRPYVLKTYAAQLALAKDAQVVLATEWADKDGALQINLTPVESPPAQGSLAVRAAWLTQRCARKIRAVSAAQQVPYALPELDRFGGVPLARDLVALEAWGADAAAQDSLFAWIAHRETDAVALVDDVGGRLSFDQLRAYALRVAALVLHFQSDKPQHARTPRQPEDQHRVALVLPKSAMALAMVLGAGAAGSLITLVQDDLAADVIRSRINDFDPDLLISGASAWSAVTKGAQGLQHRSVLICDDAGGISALEDLLETFAPATALPALAAEQPFCIVYTSGSEGRPKAAVLAAGMYTNATGLDKLTDLGDAPRIAYMGRWDAALLPDLLACLRGQAAICIPPSEDTVLSPDHFLHWMDEVGITFMSAPVSIWRGLVAARRWQRDAPSTIRGGLFWGERIFSAIVADLERTAPAIKLHCVFGATEYSYIGFGEITSEVMQDRMGSPGGQAAGETKVAPYGDANRLDMNDMQASAVEVTGANAMIGYWSDVRAGPAIRPSPTPRSVVIHDNVILRSDGHMDLLGRSDSIIKIAARRVSIISIERAAESVPGIHRAMVFQTQARGRDLLCLAFEHDGDDATLTPQLRAAVTEQVGDFAVPQRILGMAQFAQMPSGKVDRKRLKALFSGVEDTPNPSPSLPSAPEIDPQQTTLRAVRDWAGDLGYWTGPTFDPDAAVPSFSSIDVMELMLLFEDQFERPVSFTRDQLDKVGSWRALAALADEMFGARE